MRRAGQLLAATDLDLATIAERCGYQYKNILSRQFRKRYGIIPSAFRRIEG